MRLSTASSSSSRAGTAVPRRGGTAAARAASAPRSRCRRRLLRQTIAVAASSNDSPSPPPSPRKRLAVFVSGGGSNLRAIHAATQDGRVDADVVVVVSDVPGCGGWTWALEQGIETRCFPPLEARGAGKAELRARAAEALADELLSFGGEERRASSDAASPSSSSSAPRPASSGGGGGFGFGVDVVALAGYLKLVPAPLVRAFPRRMLNVHPALLPGPFGGKGFYGLRVHEAVLASGARVSGPTVHFVDEAFDRGAILAQRAVPVEFPADDAAALARRVLAAEHEVFPEALGALCAGKVRWTEGGIPYY